MAQYTLPNGNYYTFARDLVDSGNHILIAGSTGAGKSVLINDIIYSAIQYRYPFENDSESINFIWIDPKGVELYDYKNLPHTVRYACELDDIANALEWAFVEVDKRLKAVQGKARYASATPLYIVVDEMMDLVMNQDKNIVKRCKMALSHIATKGRAARVVLLMATQCPNREVLHNSIVGNVNTRIALRCNSDIESRQIVGCSDASRLPKHGTAIIREGIDLYYQTIPLTSDYEISKRVGCWVEQKRKNANIFVRMFNF